MRLVSIAVCLVLTQVSYCIGEITQISKTISIAITDAANRRDRDSVDELSRRLLLLGSEIDGDNRGYLLASGAQVWERLASLDQTAKSNAYHFGRLAREAQLDVRLDRVERRVGRIEWHPASYSSALDERPYAVARQEEAELRLRLWSKFETAYGNAVAQGSLSPVRGLLPEATPEQRSDFEAKADELGYRMRLITERAAFARSTINYLASLYQTQPIDFDELRGLVEHHIKGSSATNSPYELAVAARMPGYMRGSGATNAWDDIVSALPPHLRAQAAAAYPKPSAQRVKSGLLPVIQREPSVPAVARPSKLRERLATQGKPGMAASVPSGNSSTSPAGGVESAASEGAPAQGTPVWAWAALGLVALAGGWVWLRQRS